MLIPILLKFSVYQHGRLDVPGFAPVHAACIGTKQKLPLHVGALTETASLRSVGKPV